jgi:hypothetical protein
MKQRYLAMTKPPRPVAWWDDYDTAPRSMTVVEAADQPHDTGLLDAAGVPLYRVADREPIGFKP